MDRSLDLVVTSFGFVADTTLVVRPSAAAIVLATQPYELQVPVAAEFVLRSLPRAWLGDRIFLASFFLDQPSTA